MDLEDTLGSGPQCCPQEISVKCQNKDNNWCFFSGQKSDCMYLDWGAVYGDGPGEYENRKVEVFCIVKNHPKGWQQVQGTVNDGSLEIN